MNRTEAIYTEYLTLPARLDPQRLIFIDETWIKTNMAPLRGWGPKGRGSVRYSV